MTENIVRPGFRTCHNKGFHITFENGWTASVQFGIGNYCSNRDWPGKYGAEVPQSGTAEIAAWDALGNYHKFEGDEVSGWQTPADVLAFLNDIAGKPKQ